MFRSILFTALLVFLVTSAGAQVTSRYTDLSDTKCKTLESNPDEGGSYLGECPGVAGYKLHLIEGDLRQTIDVVAPGGKKFELGFWRFFGGFSAVGEKAEWRMRGRRPMALIVRLNVNENPEAPEKRNSYLLVAKISATRACVTDIVRPRRSQNAEARRLADRSAGKPCRTSGN